MGKAGGIVGIVAGIFGVIAAVLTLVLGGIGSAFEAERAGLIVGLGWGGLLFSFLSIVFGAVAVSRPRGGGVCLIIVSIAGAVLGGTFVAICMGLSLIGGILAVVGGGRPAAASTGAPMVSSPSSTRWVWLSVSAGVIVVVLGFMLIDKQRIAEKVEPHPTDELANARPSALRADGELSELFALGSKNTDLQRENKLKEIVGQVVQWRLPVYEVKREDGRYTIQTRTFGQDLVGAFIYITARSDDDVRKIESLKTGDLVSFKGQIAGSSLRRLDIRPAILVDEISAAQQDEVQPGPVGSDSKPPIAGVPPPAVGDASGNASSIKGRLGVVAVTGEGSKKLVVDGKPVYDSKGNAVEDDDIELVKYFSLPDKDVFIIFSTCNGSACGASGRYRFLTISESGSQVLSGAFGDGRDDATIQNDGGKIVLGFGAKGVVVLEDGGIRISKELLTAEARQPASPIHPEATKPPLNKAPRKTESSVAPPVAASGPRTPNPASNEPTKTAATTPSPAVAVLPQPVPQAVNAPSYDGSWSGTMSCSQLLVSGGRTPEPFVWKLTVLVKGTEATLRHENSGAIEEWRGRVSGDQIALQGGGHRKDDPKTAWRTGVSGTFSGNELEGKGSITSVDGARIFRDCALKLSRRSGL